MPTSTRSRLAQHPVIARIKARLDERSMPILRRTVGRVVALASKLQTDIGELTQTILQDQSFSAKILAVANGAYYRNRQEPVTTVTRAIVQIGYNTIRDIAVAAEFIDMAQARLPAGVNIQGLLAKALVAAHQAKALAEAVNFSESEGLFTSSQLHNIGDFALALYVPKEFKKLENLIGSQTVTVEEAYQQVLDLSPEELTEGVMEACHLPHELVVRTPDWSASGSWSVGDRKEALVVFANQVAGQLFAPQTAHSATRLDELTCTGAKAFGLSAARLHQVLEEAFHRACSLGKNLGLSPHFFFPPALSDGSVSEERLDPLTERCVAFAQTLEARDHGPMHFSAPDSIGSAKLLVNFLTDLTNQIMTSVDFNGVVSCVLEGLHRAVGFDHAIVLLVVPGKPLAVGRYGVGPDAPNVLASFVVSTDSTHDLLAYCMATRSAVRFNTLDELPLPLPPGVVDGLRPTAVAIGPLHLQNRAVGLIWADRSAGEIDDVMWSSFQLFMMQANLALLRLSRMSS